MIESAISEAIARIQDAPEYLWIALAFVAVVVVPGLIFLRRIRL